MKNLDAAAILSSLCWLVWGLAVGVLLWGSGVDVVVQEYLFWNYHQGFNDAMRTLGWLGLGRNQVVGCLLVGGLLWWCGRRVLARVWLACLPAFLTAGVSVIALKLLMGRARPKEVLMNGGEAYGWHPVWMEGFSSAFQSFPSGHSASTVAIATVLWCALPRWRPVVGLFAGLACASRFLAVTPHWLGDVVAGAGVGVAAGLLVVRALKIGAHVRA